MLFDICLTEILINFDYSNNNRLDISTNNILDILTNNILDISTNNILDISTNNILDISTNNISRIFDNSNVLLLYFPLNSQNNNINNPNITQTTQTIYNNLNILNNNYRNLLEESFNEKPKFKKVATKEVINTLRKESFSLENKNFKNTSCPIYYIDFEENEEITILPCNHCFNNNAIKKWLSEENNECPVCRFELSYNEIKITNNEESNINSHTDSDPDSYPYPILENNNDPQSEQYTTLENNNYQTNYFRNLQNIINRIYSTNYNNIRNNLEDYVSNNTDNREEEENTNTNNSEEETNVNNPRNLYVSRLRSNFYRQIQNIYEEDIYNRDLEEAISRSLLEQ